MKSYFILNYSQADLVIEKSLTQLAMFLLLVGRVDPVFLVEDILILVVSLESYLNLTLYDKFLACV